MTNPLTNGSAMSYSGFSNMEVGETRSHTFKNGQTKTITRTNRPFMCDWVDSSNAELENKRPPTPMRWVFPQGPMGSPQLRDMRYYSPPMVQNNRQAPTRPPMGQQRHGEAAQRA